jgi:hypothetical protein
MDQVVVISTLVTCAKHYFSEIVLLVNFDQHRTFLVNM